MSWLRELNPRLHIAAAIGWAVLGVVTVAALLTAQRAADQAEQRVRADAQALLAEYATQVRDAVSMNLVARRALLRATAVQVAVQMAVQMAGGPGAAATDVQTEAQAALQSARAQFPEFAWLGVADGRGRLVAHTGPEPAGLDVQALPWFHQGRQALYVSDQHAGLAPDGTAAAGVARWIDLAVPLPAPGVRAAAGQAGGGVLAAFLSWDWLEAQVARMQATLTETRQVELMLAARDGTLLIAPAPWQGRRLGLDVDVTEGGRYVVGSRAQLRLASDLGLGWTALVRQRTDLALAPARSTRHTVFLTVFAAGWISAVAAALAARWLTRRLTRLARDAEAVRDGSAASLPSPGGADEVGRIGATLSALVNHLQAEKQALQTLNAELDQRVAERTQRIERLADESRQAAVTRERLRIARDLHDTLAHSLMALLTQIRLVRKLHPRLAPAALDDELATAEAVAASGLADSRAAIAQMRDHGIRDSGLGPALQELVRRFGTRTGLEAGIAVDAASAALAGERAETVFRIAEEALRNVERHAGAQTVQLSLSTRAAPPGEGTAPRLHLEVADDGRGFDTAQDRPGHYGLAGMREQAALIGARLQVHSTPGQGTRVALELAL